MSIAAVALDTRRAGPVRGFLRLVVIEHSVFALPFAYLAALTAMLYDGPTAPRVDWRALALITAAMVAARTFAMATNRLVDRELDAQNPRTAGRELVTGALSVQVATVGAGVAAAVFVAVAWLLSPLCFALSPVALVLLGTYPLAKRVTSWCHVALGLAQAVAPVGAWLAVTDSWSWTAVVLGLAVGSWIGGFDVIYACQDIDSDRAHGVHSLPARVGAARALRISLAVHVLTLWLLLWFGWRAGLGPVWVLGVLATGGALLYEHSIVSAHDLRRVDRAFFTVNGFIAIGLGLVGVVDLVLAGLRP